MEKTHGKKAGRLKQCSSLLARATKANETFFLFFFPEILCHPLTHCLVYKLYPCWGVLNPRHNVRHACNKNVSDIFGQDSPLKI